MERKIKYQYSYFIYPYVIDEKKYEQYLLKLLKDKHCTLKIWEKEKDFNIYTYFLPSVRNYLFSSFLYNEEQRKQLEKLDNGMKSALLAKYSCNMFEYTLGKEVQGKVGEKNGIFFDISKMEIVCFKTGICFLVFKTIIENENDFEDVLNFNYKFRDINSKSNSLKNYENIRIQTNDLKDIKELTNIIQNITFPSKDAKEMNLEKERFLTYSYVCLEQENWNKEEDFNNLKEEFMKFSNILPSNHQVNYTEEIYEKQTIEPLKYVKIGFTKQGTAMLTSSINTENYTKLPFAYEQEYLYTYLLLLYKKIYLKKIQLELKKGKNIKKAREELLNFMKNIEMQEITQNEQGSMLCNKWKQTLELEDLSENIREQYDIAYKDLNIEKTQKINRILLVVLIGALIFNIVNFVLLFLNLD